MWIRLLALLLITLCCIKWTPGYPICACYGDLMSLKATINKKDPFEMHSFDPHSTLWPRMHSLRYYNAAISQRRNQKKQNKTHGPWWLLCHCVSAVSCRQKLWQCDCYYSTSHYTICSLRRALSPPVPHLNLKLMILRKIAREFCIRSSDTAIGCVISFYLNL